MKNNDDLLNEIYRCIAGEIFLFNSVSKKISDVGFSELAKDQLHHFRYFNNEVLKLIGSNHVREAAISKYQKLRKKTDITMSLLLNNNDSDIASYLIKETNANISLLIKCRNASREADEETIRLLNRFINFEEEMLDEVKKYL